MSINIHSIARNSNNFDFIESLGDFINNMQFKAGNDQFRSGQHTKDAYLWTALSAIGGDYSEVIYENVLNYLDNASNVDLCKVKALQSMIEVVGLKYDVLDTFKSIPVEVANLIDILSINKSYLLKSTVFCSAFIDQLSSTGCISSSAYPSELSNEIDISAWQNEGREISASCTLVDDTAYKSFLENLFANVLKKYVYLQYADAESGKLSTTHDFIYQYIQSEILASQTAANITDLTPYQQKMQKLKIKYNINKDFDQSQIVDNIENGYDSIDNYNVYEQEVLKAEILHREQSYSYAKAYSNSDQSFLGFNLTRYSYYREKKVKEYFQFIENTYNNWIVETSIADSIAGMSESNDTIATYDKDIDYFNINQPDHKSLLTYDPTTKELQIQTAYIDVIATLLAEQTLQIADIRDQVKIQIRKSYMRGTFLLMSYVVNEFLKYGVLDKYGKLFATDEGVQLGTILGSSLSSGNNVELIEYYDDTEYYNITTEFDSEAVNGSLSNPKFWDNSSSKVGSTTQDIPLNQIEEFYLEQLKLKSHGIDNVVQFLSILYEYGANNSHIDLSSGQFTCQLENGQVVGDIDDAISSVNDKKIFVESLKSTVDGYSQYGYVPLSSDPISAQLSSMFLDVSSYCWNSINDTNEQLEDSVLDNSSSSLDAVQSINIRFQGISALYEGTKTNSDYAPYLSGYQEPSESPYFIKKLSDMIVFVANKDEWKRQDLYDEVSTIRNAYLSLSSNLFTKLFALSVWPSWPYYSPNYNDELTTITFDLKSYLTSQVESATSAQLKTISAINLSSPNAWNIRYIDDEFNTLALSTQQLVESNSQYFNDYTADAYSRLDVQLANISSYIQSKDAQLKDSISSELVSISADYSDSLSEFNGIMPTLDRKLAISIQEDNAFELSTIYYRSEVYDNLTSTQQEALDFLLYGGTSPTSKLSGALNWIPYGASQFEQSVTSTIAIGLPTTPVYQELLSTIGELSSNVLSASLSDTIGVSEKLSEVVDQLSAEVDDLIHQKNYYDTKKTIYLKYSGTDVGYDPFYNYKNQAYSSYQIHPYLYNFIEKTNIISPLANSFFVTFNEEYEQDLYEKGIDNILGMYGNIKDLWKSGMFDWTGYQTAYEHAVNAKTSNSPANMLDGFSGLFYEPALDQYMEDPTTFIQNTQDNISSSYYYSLNLTDEQLDKVVQQLVEYQPMVRTLAQRWKDSSHSPSLSTEFDIYKYAEDAYGNELFLLKSYESLYAQHAGEDSYTPTYNEKKNTFGELWIRLKGHPIAFPAFDLREGYDYISQYNILSSSSSDYHPVNQYFVDLNNYLTSKGKEFGWLSSTIDIVGNESTVPNKQHLRCFFDMELDPTHRSLLLVTPFYTGKKHEDVLNSTQPLPSLMAYQNSSVIVSFLGMSFDYNNNVYVYTCQKDEYHDDLFNTNVDNIANTQMLVYNGSSIVPVDSLPVTSSSSGEYFTEFVGFAKNGNTIFALFARKNREYGSFCSYYKMPNGTYAPRTQPKLVLRSVSYKCHTPLKTQVLQSESLKFDIFSTKLEAKRASDHPENYSDPLGYSKLVGAERIVVANTPGRVTIGFISQRTQPSYDYSGNGQIVNFIEYSQMVEGQTSETSYGEDVEYPKSTALVQTTDAEKTNIYNSFDSFVQNVINVNFKITGTTLRSDGVQYFNLNSDIGFLPQYSGQSGTSRIALNAALSSRNAYRIEMLGPEQSDLPFTPVIVDTTEEKYGRVTEDYKNYNQLTACNESEIVISSGCQYAQYDFNLSSVFPSDDWEALSSTSELLRYKYILYNTKYEATPILKGSLSAQQPTGYYYQASEAYDLISGDEVIGPNGNSYQNIDLTNHINNISSIQLSIVNNEETLLPDKVIIRVSAREVPTYDQVIPVGQFQLFIYVKNNIKTYDYYHLFENSNQSLSTLTQDQVYSIDFSTISSLSTYEFDVGDGQYVKPFAKQPLDAQKFSQMSATLEFQYSEEDVIDREFPYLDASDVEDEITITQNNPQNSYFFSIDTFEKLETLSTFYMEVYQPETSAYTTEKIVPTMPKYKDFYNKALTIDGTYNIEKIDGASLSGQQYEIVQYFNYKNFTNPQYINYTKGIPLDDGKYSAPSAVVYNPSDEALNGSWLRLVPGQSGKIDLSVNFVKYGKIHPTDIEQSVLGIYAQNIASYYIMNVSDDKPKFVISRQPFSSISMPTADDNGNYELES